MQKTMNKGRTPITRSDFWQVINPRARAMHLLEAAGKPIRPLVLIDVRPGSAAHVGISTEFKRHNSYRFMAPIDCEPEHILAVLDALKEAVATDFDRIANDRAGVDPQVEMNNECIQMLHSSRKLVLEFAIETLVQELLLEARKFARW